MKKLSALFLCLLLGFSLPACNDDPVDDQNDSSEDLVLSSSSISVAVDETKTVSITGGNGEYTAEVTDGENFASVTVSENVVSVTGLAKGNATVTVTDKDDKTATLSVTVTEEDEEEGELKDLTLSKSSVILYMSWPAATVKVSSGNGGYSADITKGENVVSISVTDEDKLFQVEITPLAMGDAEITFTDAKEQTVVLPVKVGEDGVVHAMFEQNMTRTMQMMDAVVDKCFYGVAWAMYFSYNPVAEKRSTRIVSVWEYISAIEVTNSILRSLKAYKEYGNNIFYDTYFNKYVELIDNLYEGARYYRGPFRVTSYTRNINDPNASWMVYAVNRGSYDTANAAGSNNTGNVYDDMMWLLREMLDSYLTIGGEKYLEAGEYLAEYCLDGWDCTLDSNGDEYGGITWGPGYSSTHACSNGPFVSPLVWLHEIYKDSEETTLHYYIDPTDRETRLTKEVKKSDYYLDFAKRVYDYHHRMYMPSSGTKIYNDMRGGGSIRYVTVNNVEYRGGNFTTLASVNASSGTKFSYNSGTMLSGAADLYRITGDQRYVDNAKALTTASRSYFPQTSLGDGRYRFRNTDNTGRWQDWIMLRGLVDMYAYDNGVKDYLDIYQNNLDYAYENLLYDGFFPNVIWSGEWDTATPTNTSNDVYAQVVFSYLAEYAALARHELQAGN